MDEVAAVYRMIVDNPDSIPDVDRGHKLMFFAFVIPMELLFGVTSVFNQTLAELVAEAFALECKLHFTSS